MPLMVDGYYYIIFLKKLFVNLRRGSGLNLNRFLTSKSNNSGMDSSALLMDSIFTNNYSIK